MTKYYRILDSVPRRPSQSGLVYSRRVRTTQVWPSEASEFFYFFIFGKISPLSP